MQHTLNLTWGLNQVGLAIILQTFVANSRTANILGYTCAVTVQFVCLYTSLQFFPTPFEVPTSLLLVPQMSYSRLYYFMSKQCLESRCMRSLGELRGEGHRTLVVFLATGLMYPVIGVLMNAVNFSFKKYTSLKGKAKYSMGEKEDGDVKHKLSSGGEAGEMEVIDPASWVNDEIPPIIVKGVHKVYQKAGANFTALHPTTFRVNKGEVLGLLGPNGAGKTTLISILTGLIKPTSGEAWVGGHHVLTDLPSVYKSIGVCPQFDLFWEDLTIEEHLLFYLRLKGSDTSTEDERIREICSQVELREHMHKQAKSLSGGMKRRLSLAVALAGDPKAVFLDEPTTGLDPLNREGFWKIIEKVKANKAIILTTHLMQEADFLSDRIGTLRVTSHHRPRLAQVHRHAHGTQARLRVWRAAAHNLRERLLARARPRRPGLRRVHRRRGGLHEVARARLRREVLQALVGKEDRQRDSLRGRLG